MRECAARSCIRDRGANGQAIRHDRSSAETLRDRGSAAGSLGDDILGTMASHPSHTPVNADNLPAPVGPYSAGMAFERLVFVSGQGATNPATGTLAGVDIGAQTEQWLRNVGAILVAGRFRLPHGLRVGVVFTHLGGVKR